MSHSPIPLHLSLHLLAFASACVLSRFTYVWLFATLWTVALQAPLSMGFSRQEYWSGLPCPSPGHLPNPRIEPTSSAAPALQEDSLLLSHQGSPGARRLSFYLASLSPHVACEVTKAVSYIFRGCLFPIPYSSSLQRWAFSCGLRSLSSSVALTGAQKLVLC